METSQYIEREGRDFSLYVLQSRAIPSISDGLKVSGRRLLWMGRDGKKYKTATLAGQTMEIHPHAEASDAINTLTGPYINNVPLFDGIGTFGTRLNPLAFGAPRYTDVKVSQFTKDTVFRDIELIPMQRTYDDRNEEPTHFLPLVPLVLLNGSEGIAVGFATNILPRDLHDLIDCQIKHLTKKKFDAPQPIYKPLGMKAVGQDEDNPNKWYFEGSYDKVKGNTLKVTSLPPQMTHEKFVDHLIKLVEDKKINDFTDNSKDTIDIDIKIPATELLNKKSEQILTLLKLRQATTENINVLNFDGETVVNLTSDEIIRQFTDWRLTYYKRRYERLKSLLEEDIQKYKDIILAIKKNVGGVAKKVSGLAELKELLEAYGIVNIDYIASLPVYRFTEEEKEKVEKKLSDALDLLAEYEKIIKSSSLQIKQYITELKEIRSKY